MWTDIDDTRVYSTLDLPEFEHTFSAYQRREGSDSDIFRKDKEKPRELSVIDGRRAQNCTILLSKLKMSNKDLAEAVRNMDPKEDLPKDMCEQVSVRSFPVHKVLRLSVCSAISHNGLRAVAFSFSPPKHVTVRKVDENKPPVRNVDLLVDFDVV